MRITKASPQRKQQACLAAITIISRLVISSAHARSEQRLFIYEILELERRFRNRNFDEEGVCTQGQIMFHCLFVVFCSLK